MAFKVADRIKDTSTNTGTGVFQVTGTASQGHRTFADICSVNDTFVYSIQNQTTNEFEVGVGTYSGTNQITRNTVWSSSNNNDFVNFGAGTKDVFLTMAANNLVYRDHTGNVNVAGQLHSTSYGYKFPDGSVQRKAAIEMWDFSRESIAISANSVTGQYYEAGINERKYDANGALLIEEAATNSILNNTMQGAGPGSFPTGWLLSSSIGLTWTPLGKFTVNGVDVFRVRVNGNASTVSTQTLTFMPYKSAPANVNETWVCSNFFAVSNGSTSNINSIYISGRFRDASNTYLQFGPSIYFPLGTANSTLIRYEGYSTATNASTTQISPQLNFYPNNTTSQIDITFDIGWPQAEQGSRASSPILTYGVAQTRAADIQKTGIIYAEQFPTLKAALYSLQDGGTLVLKGGKTYTYSDGQIDYLPNNVTIMSEGGAAATIDFSENSSWNPNGLIRVNGSLNLASQTSITSTLTANPRYYIAASGYATGNTCTIQLTQPHDFANGDYVFIRDGSDIANNGQTAYCTEYPSNEGQSLDKPVAITVISANAFTYTAYSAVPDPTMTIYPAVYKNNQVARVSDSSGFSRGDFILIQSSDTYTSFTGTQTVSEGELFEIKHIIDTNNIMLSEPVNFTFTTSPKIAKISKNTIVLRDLIIKGKGYFPEKPFYLYSDIGFYSFYAFRPILENVTFIDCDYRGVWHRSTYYPYTRNCKFIADGRDEAGKTTGQIETTYGFSWGNATKGAVYVDCEAFGGRHGFDEAASGGTPGRSVNIELVRPKIFQTWSNAIDTHGLYKKFRIIDPFVSGCTSSGVSARAGSIFVSGARVYGAETAINLYGEINDCYIEVIDCDVSSTIVLISPNSDIAANTPASKGITIAKAIGKAGEFGVRLISPSGHAFVDTQIQNINVRDSLYYPVYLSGTGHFIRPKVTNIHGLNTGAMAVRTANTIDGFYDQITLCSSGSIYGVYHDSSNNANAFFGTIKVKSTTGGTETPYNLNGATGCIKVSTTSA